MRRLETTNYRYWIIENPDGTLLITINKRDSIPNAGLFILQMGGVEAIKKRLQGDDLTLEQAEQWEKDFYSNLMQRKKENREKRAKEREEKERIRLENIVNRYNDLLTNSENGIIPTTYENIGIVLRYLNTRNWGGWDLPKMTIPYSCNQYDCDGKQASTMILAEPIEVYDGEMATRFQVGAPHGHLIKYRRCI